MKFKSSFINKLVKRFKEWRRKREWNTERQITHIRNTMIEDHRWLASNRIAVALLERYIPLVKDHWESARVDDISQFRTKHGLDPNQQGYNSEEKLLSELLAAHMLNDSYENTMIVLVKSGQKDLMATESFLMLKELKTLPIDKLVKTASTYRSTGIPISDSVPDHAVLARHGVLDKDIGEPGTVDYAIKYSFLSPFEWVEKTKDGCVLRQYLHEPIIIYPLKVSEGAQGEHTTRKA